MLAALEALRGEFRFELEVIDIDANPEKMAQYDQWIPVLTHADKEICHYFLDPAKVREVLAGFR